MMCCNGNCSQCPQSKAVVTPQKEVEPVEEVTAEDKALSLVVKKTFTGKLKAVKEK